MADIDFKPIDFQEETAPQQEISTLGALGLGAAKGVTLGFDDEIAGLAKAITDKAGGGTADFWDTYKKIRDSVRSTHAAAEEQHPIASIGGELAGGLVLPVPGLGAIGSEAGFLAKAGAMAKTGLKAGAIAGLGGSTADLTQGDVGGAAGDVAKGAALGGVTGAGLQALGSTVSTAAEGLGKVAKSFPITQEVIDQFNIHRSGKDLLGQFPQLSEKSSSVAEKAMDKISAAKKLMGEFMNASKEALDERNFKVDIQDKVNEAREAINKLKPVGKEADDVEELKAILGNMVDEVEKPYFVKAASTKAPAMGTAEKAERVVGKKTAEAQARDFMTTQNLQAALEEAQAAGDDETVAKIQSQLAKVQNNTEYPPQNILDETTGLPVKGVNRGLGKQPIAEAMLPEVPSPTETFYQPLEQRTQTVQQRPSVNLQELDAEINRLRDFIKTASSSTTKQAAKNLISQLEAKVQEATSDQPEIADILNQYQQAKKQYGQIAETQGLLGVKKGAYGYTEGPKREADIKKIKGLMDKLQDPGSEGAKQLQNALDTLDQAAPGTAKQLRDQMTQASREEYLAGQTTAEGGLSKSLGTLFAGARSVPLLAARAAGKAVNAVETASANPSQGLLNLGTKVYEATPEQLKTLAETASQTGKHFAPVLQRLVNAPLNKRKALLFTLMQQPEFREFVSGSGSDNEVPQ